MEKLLAWLKKKYFSRSVLFKTILSNTVIKEQHLSSLTAPVIKIQILMMDFKY